MIVIYRPPGSGGLSDVVDDTTPQLGGELDAQGNNITELGDVTFKTGASGGVIRTGTANADKFVLAAYDVNDGVYRTVIELDAGNTVVLQIIADFLAIEDDADTTKHVEWDISGATGNTATTLVFAQTADRTVTFPNKTGTLLTNLDVGTIAIADAADYLQTAGGNMDGDINMQDAVIKRAELTDYSETINSIGSIGGGTQDIDLTLGNVVSATVDTSTTTFTFSNPPDFLGGSFTLFLTNGGSQTVNWPASVTWAAGSAPSLEVSGVNILTFTTIDGGTIWYGFVAYPA